MILLAPAYQENGLPETASLLAVMNRVTALLRSGKAVACYTPGLGGVAEAVMKMAFGNMLGFRYEAELCDRQIFGYAYGSFLLELTEDVGEGVLLGETVAEPALTCGETVALSGLLAAYEGKLEPVYPTHAAESHRRIWAHNDEQDATLADHETRLRVLESSREG